MLHLAMATTCLNCGTLLTGNYCSHCGQKATVGRLSWHHVGEEIVHFFTHIEKGFLKTTIDLIISPGRMHKSFLDGKRKAYHKPVSFLLIWVAIFLLVTATIKRFSDFDPETSATLFGIGRDVEAMILKYRALIEILILPFTAFNGWLLLCYPRISYLEFLVTGFYRFGVFYIFLTLLYLLGFMVGFNPESTVSIYSFALVIMAWTIYVFYDFFKLYNIKYLVLRIVVTMLIGVVIYSFLRSFLGKLFLDWGF